MLTKKLTSKELVTQSQSFEAIRDFFDLYSKNLIGAFDRNPDLFYQNFVAINLAIYRENRNDYFIYHDYLQYINEFQNLQFGENVQLGQNQYLSLFIALIKKYMTETNRFEGERDDPNIIAIISQIVEDLIISKMQGTTDIEQLLNRSPKVYSSQLQLRSLGVEQELENLNPPQIREDLREEANKTIEYVNKLLIVNNKSREQINTTNFMYTEINYNSNLPLFNINDYHKRLSEDSLMSDQNLFLSIYFQSDFSPYRGKQFYFFADAQDEQSMGLRLEKIDSYRLFVQVLDNYSNQNKRNLGLQLVPQFDQFINQFIDSEIMQDEYFQDLKLINTLIVIYPQMIYTIQKYLNPVYNTDYYQMFNRVYVAALLSGNYSLYLSRPSDLVIMIVKILLVLFELMSTNMRKNFGNNVVQIIITYCLIKLKTLYTSSFYAEAVKQGTSYSNEVQLYIIKFVVARGCEIFDLHVNKIFPLMFDLQGRAPNQLFINSQFADSQKFNDKELLGEHLSRIAKFAKARNNLIQLLDVRLPQVLELFKRHVKMNRMIRQIMAESRRKEIMIFDSSVFVRTYKSTFTKFEPANFWNTAFQFMTNLYKSSNDAVGRRKIRLMEILFIDWGTMRYLSQMLQNSQVDQSSNYRPYFASDNYGLLYGPSNALLFYGTSLQLDTIYPDMDETTLAYDIRELLRPDTNLEIVKTLRYSLISETTSTTVQILGKFIKYFSRIYNRSSENEQLRVLDTYADMRYKFLITTLYAIEFFDKTFYLGDVQVNFDDQDFQDQAQRLALAADKEFNKMNVIEQQLASGQIQEATLSKLQPDNSKMEIEQIRLSKKRQLAKLVSERDSLTDQKEAKFYLNYIQINAVAAINAAIYSAFVKNSLRGKNPTELNLNSPLLLENTMSVLQESTKKLVNLGVLKLFDLQASFYNQVKYRLISDDMQIFLNAKNKKANILEGLKPEALEVAQIESENQRTENLVLAIRENRQFRAELINELVTKTNENLQPLLLKVQNIEQVYRQEIETAQLIELDLRRSLSEPIISDRAQDLILRALEETRVLNEQMDREVQNFLEKIEGFNKVLIELNKKTDDEPDAVDFSQFFEMRDDFLTMLNQLTLKMQNFLFTGSEPLQNDDGSLSEDQLSKFIDVHFQRISSAIKTRLTTRQSRDLAVKLGANGQIRLNSMLSNADEFKSLLRAVINDEITKPAEKRDISNTIKRVLIGERRGDVAKNIEQFIKDYFNIL